MSQVNNSKYLYSDGTYLYKSNNAAKYEELVAVNRNITNVQVIKIEDYYYFIGELGMSRTSDFISYEDIDVSLINNSDYTSITNLRLFQDANNKWHISYQATKDKTISFYIADYSYFDNAISNAYQQITISTDSYDPHIFYLNSKYFIFTDNSDVYYSDNLLSGYEVMATNISTGSSTYTKPFVMQAGDYLYLYQLKDDAELTYRVARAVNPIVWSNEDAVDGISASGGFFYDSAVYTAYPDYDDTLDTFDPIVVVKALSEEQKSVLTCLLWSTFEVQWTKNNSWQVTFTAYDDDSPSYDMLTVEASIYFNGQEYIVKTCESDYAGNVNTKQITATHIYNELQYVKQSTSTSDTLTYTISEVLEYYLGSSNSTANYRGFSYAVYGDFDKQQISSMGGNSAKDMLSTITSTWTDAIIFPDNLVINIYTPAAFEKTYGRRIDYLNNAKSVTITVDSTDITNQVYCVGKTYENSDDNSTTEYYFTPFTYTDTDSVKMWKLHPHDDINDERFTSADSMKEYAISQLQTDPSVSAEVEDITNDVPIPGEIRHLKVNEDYETDVMLIGYTWYPFSPSNVTVLEFDNLPASILTTQAKINNQLRSAQLLAQQALNKAGTATTNYFSSSDPTDNTTVRVGDMWTRELDTT